MVVREIFDGLSNWVVSGEVTYWFPPEPPLPVTEILLREASPPNWLIPARLDGTLNAMPAIGTFPIVVLAVTSAVPFSVKTVWEVSVTC